MTTQPWLIKGDYQKKVSDFIQNYKRQCLLNKIDYVPLDTTWTYDRALMEYILKRKKIGG